MQRNPDSSWIIPRGKAVVRVDGNSLKIRKKQRKAPCPANSEPGKKNDKRKLNIIIIIIIHKKEKLPIYLFAAETSYIGCGPSTERSNS